MSEDRMHAALARIDSALARIERAARGGDPALARRHERLREATQAAVAELDTLIAAGGR